MTNEEIIKGLTKMLNNTIEANECGLSNNDLRLENIQLKKQIDLMANCILAREIGKMTCQFNEKCTKYENGRDIHCKDCIKQYFTNLIEKVKVDKNDRRKRRINN